MLQQFLDAADVRAGQSIALACDWMVAGLVSLLAFFIITRQTSSPALPWLAHPMKPAVRYPSSYSLLTRFLAIITPWTNSKCFSHHLCLYLKGDQLSVYENSLYKYFQKDLPLWLLPVFSDSFALIGIFPLHILIYSFYSLYIDILTMLCCGEVLIGCIWGPKIFLCLYVFYLRLRNYLLHFIEQTSYVLILPRGFLGFVSWTYSRVLRHFDCVHYFLKTKEPTIVLHTCNPNIWGTEIRGWGIHGEPGHQESLSQNENQNINSVII